MEKDSWLIVANSSLARIFNIKNIKTLQELNVLKHPESRLHNMDLVSDKPGRDFESVGMGSRHGLDGGVTPKQHEFAVFAKELATYLEHAYTKGEFKSLYIAASPLLLGLLRNAMNGSSIKAISKEIDKDLTHLKAEEILPHLDLP